MDGTEVHKCAAGRPGQMRGDLGHGHGVGHRMAKNTCREALVVVYAPSEKTVVVYNTTSKYYELHIYVVVKRVQE